MNRLLTTSWAGFLTCIAVVGHATPAPGIFKCLSADGKSKIYTDSPAKHVNCRSLAGIEVEVGMSKALAKQTAGVPYKVTYEKTRQGKTERWIYKSGLTLTLENGIVEKVEQE